MQIIITKLTKRNVKHDNQQHHFQTTMTVYEIHVQRMGKINIMKYINQHIKQLFIIFQIWLFLTL